MSAYPIAPPPWVSNSKRPRLEINSLQEFRAAGIVQTEIRDVLSPELPRSSRQLQPHHRATRPVVSAAASHSKPQSRPSTAPPPYESINSNTSFSPSSVLDIPPVRSSSMAPRREHRTHPMISQTSSHHHLPTAHTGHGLFLSHSTTSFDRVASSPMNPNEQKFARILRPIKSSLSLTQKDGSKDHKRQRKASLPSRDSSVDLTKEHPPLPTKPNVLKSPRRPRTTSSTITLPLAPRFDAELGNLSRPKSRTASTSNSSLPKERALRPLPPLPTRPHTSSGDPSSRPRAFLSTDPQRQGLIKRPTTAPAAYVAPFNENAIPTREQLSQAASLPVIAENGVQVPFGNLFLGGRTVVIFIRHFFCPLCQDYMTSISRNVNPTVLKRAGVNLVIVSNGSHNMIKSYRQIFRTPFAVYIDPTLRVYKTLGMTLRTLDPGPDSEKGGYIRHGLVGGITMVVKNAIKAKMPVWGKAGDTGQLGGEFVLGPGLKCTFAHRMRNTRSHAPIQHVLAAAGVDIYARWEQTASVCSALLMTDAEEAQWMEERNRSLAKLKEKKSFRRGGEAYCGGNTCERVDVRAQTVGSESRTVSPSSTNTCIGDDDETLGKMLEIRELSKSVLVSVSPEDDNDASLHAKNHPPMHADIFPSTISTADARSLISSASDLGSCWDYYFEQSPRTD